MKIMNALLYFILCLSSFELNAQSIPIAPEAPQYPLPQTPKPHVIKESKYTKEAKDNRESQKRLIMHDAMIFFDVSEIKPGAITNDFSVAICQSGYSKIGYPIIGTSHIYHAFLTYNSDIVQKSIPATLARFDIYKTVTEDFYVLIPKTYLKHAEQSYSDKEKEELQKVAAAKGFALTDFLTGFALSKLVRVTDPAQKNIKVVRAIDVESLKSVFLQKKDIEQKNVVVKKDGEDPASSQAADKRFISQLTDIELLGMWNFVLDGHGYYSWQLRDQIKRGMLPGQMKQLKEDQFADALITGLKLNQYRDLLQFFIQNINTHFLYYTSCYAGGYNTILGYVDALINNKGNLVSRAKPNFIIAAGALSDNVVGGIEKKTLEDCLVCALKSEEQPVAIDTCIINQSMNMGIIKYINFFSLLHAYARTDRLAGTLFNDAQLRNILSEITGRFKTVGLDGIPQVMFPGTNIFRAVDIDGKISVITNSLVKTHALEAEDKKPIVIKDKDLILVYPLEIPVELNISAKKAPRIFSMPANVSLQKFEKINFNNLTFKDFLISLSSLALAFDKYIYIKNLTLMNDEFGIPSVVGSVTLKNVLINMKEKTLQMIYCDEKGNVYQNHFILDRRNDEYSHSSKLLYRFFHVIKPENQFLDTMLNYFSYPQIRQEFSYDTIFVNLLSPNEARTIETAMEDMDAVRSSGVNEKISVITNYLVKTHALESEDKKPIIIKDKDLIVVYSLEIPVELNISGKKAPRIISKPAGVSLQKFEKINFNSLTFKDFLISISSLASSLDKYIYIKNLTLMNDEYGISSVVGSVTLKNVLININEHGLRMIYCDEKGNVYENYFSSGQPGYSSKLLYPFFNVLKPENKFLDTMVNYFSYPRMRELFSYDTIFVKVLSPNEARAIETGIQGNAKARHAKMLEIAAEDFPDLNIKQIDAALTAYYKISPDVLIKPDEDGTHMSPLNVAAFNGDYNGVDALIKVGADIDWVYNPESRSSLMYAILSKNSKSKNEIVKLLLEKGADISLRDKEGKTAEDMIGDNAELKKIFEDFKKQNKDKKINKHDEIF